jgi:hypothetical protein
VARQALLVAGVTRLVDDAHQAGDELLLVVARGDAHVRRHAAAERVAAHVEPAVGKIKAEQPHHLLAERLLRRNRERALRGEEGSLFCRSLTVWMRPGSQLVRSPKI